MSGRVRVRCDTNDVACTFLLQSLPRIPKTFVWTQSLPRVHLYKFTCTEFNSFSASLYRHASHASHMQPTATHTSLVTWSVCVGLWNHVLVGVRVGATWQIRCNNLCAWRCVFISNHFDHLFSLLYETRRSQFFHVARRHLVWEAISLVINFTGINFVITYSAGLWNE